jgi:hypothetical protein
MHAAVVWWSGLIIVWVVFFLMSEYFLFEGCKIWIMMEKTQVFRGPLENGKGCLFG